MIKSMENNRSQESLPSLILRARQAEFNAWERANSTTNFFIDFLGGTFAPTIGDMATSWYFYELAKEDAVAIGMPAYYQRKILQTYVLDAVLGVIPGLGDLIDLFYKANKKSAEVFTRYRIDLEHQLTQQNYYHEAA